MSDLPRSRSSLSRRQFVQGAGIAGLGLLAGCGRLPGQPPARVPRIEVLSPGPPLFGCSPPSDNVNPFRQGLQEQGYEVGRDVLIEYRSAEGRPEKYRDLADDLVRMNVDVVVAYADAIQSTREATGTIPIVMAISDDPVRYGHVASLSRPGGNVTGLSLMAPS